MDKLEPLIFSTGDYVYMMEKIVSQGGFARGEMERERFPDGELKNQIISDVNLRDTILVAGTNTAEETQELYDVACGLAMYGALSLKLVVPYFAYSTMERAVKEGEVVKAKTRARQLSSIPRTAHGNRIMMVELHVPGMQHYFEGDMVRQHVNATALIVKAIRDLGLSDFVVCSTDEGRAKQVRILADELGMTSGYVQKRRISGGRTEVIGISADVKGRIVVIYDDMIRSGSSLLKAAHEYRKYGALDVFAIATHGVFPGDAVDKLRKDGSISKIICTDSHPRAIALADNNFLKIESVAPLLAKLLKESVRLL